MNKRKRNSNQSRLRLELLEDRRLLVASADVTLPAEVRAREVAELSITSLTDLDVSDISELRLDWGDGQVTSIPSNEIVFPLTRLHTYYAVPTALSVETIAVLNDDQILSLSSDVVSLVANSPAVTDRTEQGLTADIFTNLEPGFDFTATPDSSRIDPTIAFDFGSSSPDYRLGIAGDPFAIRWTGTFHPESNLLHTFYAQTAANDQLQLIIDGTTVIDTFGSATDVEQSFAATLNADVPVDIVVQYIAASGSSAIEIGVETNETFKTALPSHQLAPSQSVSDLRSGILVEEFTTSAATDIAELRATSDFIGNTPDNGFDLANFSYVDDITRENATRIRAILTAPVSGEYTFHLAGSETAELWLSQNTASDNSNLIANIDAATPVDGFLTANAGLSDPIFLIAGQDYYIETLHVHNSTTEIGHVSVGWTRPDTPTDPPSVISVDHLRPITPSVSIRAEVSQSYEYEPLAIGSRFVIERDDDLGRDLEVAYTLGGTAENGVDFQALTGIATIPAGETSVTINVDPIDDGILEGTETAVVRLVADPAYQLNLENERQITLTIAGEVQGGTQLLPQDFDTFLASGFNRGLPLNQFTTDRETDESLPFVVGTTDDNFVRVEVNSFVNPWDVLVGFEIAESDLPEGAQVFGSLWARSGVPGEQVSVGTRVEQSSAPFQGTSGFWEIGDQWTPIVWPFVSEFGGSTADRTFDVRLGFETQTVDLAGFSLIVFSEPFDETTLPTDFFNYSGRDTDALWRSDATTSAAANQNIPADITIVDSFGNPVSSSRITVVPIEPTQQIGTSVTPERIVPTSDPFTQTDESLRYASIVANNFATLTDSGSAQWGPWINNPVTPTDFANWTVDNQLPYHGHSVIWGELDSFPVPDFLLSGYEQVVANESLAAGEAWLENEILSFIQSGPAAAFSASRPDSDEAIVALWDVVNHPVFSRDIWDIVGDDFILDVIDATRNVVHPDTTLRINESSVLTPFGSHNADDLFDFLTQLDAAAPSGRADYDLIGFQAHTRSSELPAIDEIISQLARFSTFDRPIQITEFDVDSAEIDRQTQADFTRDFFEVLAATEQVDLTTIWGFWQEEHWRSSEGAEWFSTDWVPHANGQWFLDQRTESFAATEITTDQQGRFQSNFSASEVLIYIDGVQQPIPVTLTSQPITIQTQTPWQFVVNTVSDTPDANLGDGVAQDADGLTSLRAAIQEANFLANSALGIDQITFDIPGSAPHVISVATALPTITESVVIDATTQPGYSSAPVIELRDAGDVDHALQIATDSVTILGISATEFDNGLHIVGGGNHLITDSYFGIDTSATSAGNNVGIRVTDSANNVLDSNVVSGNDASGIFLQGESTANTLVNNLVGTDPTGQTAIGNGSIGVLVHGPGNVIGQPNQGNVISGNQGTGLALTSDALNSIVQGNNIGTNVDGDTPLGNSNFGLLVATAGNTIGGSYLDGGGNLISGNARHGLVVSGAAASDNSLTGNFVGVNATGDAAIANGSFGVFVVNASNNTIGSTDVGATNLISGNQLSGVVIRSANSNELIGNRIGTNLDATTAIPNQSVGVSIARGASDNQVLSNLVSGNSASGIAIVDAGSENNVVQNNLVGTNLDATAAISNGPFAVLVQTANNVIGGTIDQGNVIAGSTRGVVLSSANATGNQVSGNTIGTDSTGTANLGLTTGVQIGAGAAGNVIGPANTIANNTTGVRLIGSSGDENTVTQSNFVNNTLIGIDIAGLGPTANDVGDQDEGTNRTLNFPVISSANISATDLSIAFDVPVPTTAATYDLTIEFFLADSFGQGNEYLWSTTYTPIDIANGEVTFVAPVGSITLGDWITATTTDADGNTSEFAAPVFVSETSQSSAVSEQLELPSGARTPLDVSADGMVSAIDALLVINDLNNAEGEQNAPARSDVNGDNQVTAIDALRILNFLQTATETPRLEAISTELADSVFAIDEDEADLSILDVGLF